VYLSKTEAVLLFASLVPLRFGGQPPDTCFVGGLLRLGGFGAFILVLLRRRAFVLLKNSFLVENAEGELTLVDATESQLVEKKKKRKIK
jgi:hypothetical protein